MKKILILCEKPYVCRLVKDYLEKNNNSDGFYYASCELVTTSTDPLIRLERKTDGYYLDGEKTDKFADLSLKSIDLEEGKYAVCISEIREREVNTDVDYVLSVNFGYQDDILASIEFCERHNIPKEKVFTYCSPALTEESLSHLLDIDLIVPLFEKVETMSF